MPLENDNDWINSLKNELDTMEQKKALPDIPNFEVEVEEYCKGINGDRTHCLHEVQNFAQTRIASALTNWRVGMSNLCTEFHKHIQTRRFHLRQEEDEMKARLQVLKNKNTQKEVELQDVEQQVDSLRKQQANIEPATKYALFSYLLFIIASVTVGFLTFWYYVNIQGQAYYLTTGKEIVTFQTWTFISQEGGWIYGFGVVGVLMAGKIISIIYEKIGFAKWFFLIMAFISIIIVIGAVVNMSWLSGYQNELALTNNEIKQKSFTHELTDLLGETKQSNDCTKSENSKTDYCNLQLKQKEISDHIRSLDVPNKILTFLADILLGAVAWMLAVDYHNKSGSQPQLLRNKLANLEQRKLKYEQDKDNYEQEIQGVSERIEQINKKRMAITSLQGRLPTDEDIQRLHQTYEAKYREGDATLIFNRVWGSKR
jgi:hypothetical protein